MLGSSPGPPATPSSKECGGHALRGSRAPSGVSQGVPLGGPLNLNTKLGGTGGAAFNLKGEIGGGPILFE